jgi:hypothetical protein
MPEKKTVQRARTAKRQGKAATTQAGAFVGEEMRHAKSGKHPVKNKKQAIAIGLSKARRAGVKVPAKKGRTSRAKPAARTRKTATRTRKPAARTAKPAARTRKTGARSAASRTTTRTSRTKSR